MAESSNRQYYTYLLRCKDGSIYTGITTDLARRAAEHFSDRTHSRYTHTHRAIKMEAAFCSDSRSDAARLEYRIKRLPRSEKERIILTKTLDPLKNTTEIGKYRYTEPPESSGL